MIKKLLINIYKKNEIKKMEKIQNKKLIKYKELINKVNLTNEQIKAVDDLWINNYGKKITKDWHRLYTSYDGNFNEKYFPENLLLNNLIFKTNSGKRKNYWDDKILYTYLFSNVKEKKFKMSKNYVYNCSGYFYDENSVITYEEAVNKLFNIGEVVIKPTTESGQGRDVRLLEIKNGIDIKTNDSIEKIFNKYKENYTFQEKIIQHSTLAKLNPTSVNSFRIWSYIFEGEVYVTTAALRMGRLNSSLADNFGAGGVAVGVKSDGTLLPFGYTAKGEKFSEHPDTHIKFEGYKIPRFLEMIQFVRKNHYRIPHMGIVAWDITLDADENIVLIEVNFTWPGIRILQDVTGEAFFGEHTEKMIQMLRDDYKK